MSAGLPVLVRALIEGWARLYTLGLPPEARRERLDLIRADVWDEMGDASASALSPGVPAASLLSRCLRGMPADVTWRLFDAPRSQLASPVADLGRGESQGSRSSGLVFFAVVSGIAWAAVMVLGLQPVPHSLAYAGGLLGLASMLGWAIEARDDGDDESGTSVWPVMLALSIVTVAGGVVFDDGRLGLVLAGPVALGFSLAFGRQLAMPGSFADSEHLTEPLPASEVAAHAGRGEAIAIEASHRRGMTRRTLLRGSFVVGMASMLAAMGGVVIDFLWQRDVAGFGGVVTAGKVGDFPAGSKTVVSEGKFWLVNLTAEQGGPGFLALWQKCPHLGYVVPWREDFSWIDPQTGRRTQGWFRCPCHQSTYNDAGVRVYGPAPRSMDRMALDITAEGVIEVNTGAVSKGSDDNASYAVEPPLSKG